MNLMTVDGYSAKREYDSDTDLFCGEILDLNGGAEFYGANPEELRHDFKKSLDFLWRSVRRRGLSQGNSFEVNSTSGFHPSSMRGLRWQHRLREKAWILWRRKHWTGVSPHRLWANNGNHLSRHLQLFFAPVHLWRPGDDKR